MCSLSQAAQNDIMQQLAIQETQTSFLQLLHGVSVGKPQTAFAAVVLSTI
jgi:hypothetical protein